MLTRSLLSRTARQHGKSVDVGRNLYSGPREPGWNEEEFQKIRDMGDDSGPIVMLNLVKVKDQEALDQYTEAVFTNFEAPSITYIGARTGPVPIGNIDSHDWDMIACVEYPSPQAFIDMVDSDTYAECYPLRHAGVERASLVVTSPMQMELPE